MNDKNNSVYIDDILDSINKIYDILQKMLNMMSLKMTIK